MQFRSCISSCICGRACLMFVVAPIDTLSIASISSPSETPNDDHDACCSCQGFRSGLSTHALGHVQTQLKAGSRRGRSAWWRMQVSRLCRGPRLPRRHFCLRLPFSVPPAVPQGVGPLKTSHARACKVLEHLRGCSFLRVWPTSNQKINPKRFEPPSTSTLRNALGTSPGLLRTVSRTSLHFMCSVEVFFSGLFTEANKHNNNNKNNGNSKLTNIIQRSNCSCLLLLHNRIAMGVVVLTMQVRME